MRDRKKKEPPLLARCECKLGQGGSHHGKSRMLIEKMGFLPHSDD